ncbi:MAG TPA: type I DNA topoisomerase [Bacteroidia bacterium]|nr:type I DNA topoisomerase [Bacteroidia bacterium]HNS12921.1 type I DNA topoisomerase [Bacteroidia bacterium]
MSKNLVIVESPAKAKTIEGYLGKDFIVKSSYGHVRDLVKSGKGIEIENNFNPVYEVSADKEQVITDLMRQAKKADTVWLATDEDREGEAISWHLFETLNLKEASTKRIVFHEITKKAILAAIENPRKIDKNLVDAQQARRILDRLVGFELSPVLWKKVKPSLSAGRVQSVTVRLVVEREREIDNFKVTSAFKVVGYFEDNGKSFKAELPKRFKTEEEAEEFLKACSSAQFSVENLEVKPGKRTPSAPFTTSTLQQEASRKLGFSVAQTMVLAQRLYESGKITYMRTDSVNLSQDALDMAKTSITSMYGPQYVEIRTYKNKSANAQEAHEAIRPTEFSRSEVEGEAREQKLYDLIWKRTIASQMADAKLEKTVVTISSPKTKDNFIASGEVIKFDGFLKVYMEGSDDEEEKDQEGILPPMKIGDKLNLLNIVATERFTHASPRYTEASLVKKLEELGIGRPSTYAPTISTVQKRGYVLKEERQGKERAYQVLTLKDSKITKETQTEITGAEKNKLFPTDIGMLVTDFLVDNFKDILDYNFTAFVEKEFDDIANGELKWQKMIKEFYGPFHETVETTEKDAERVTGERILGKDPVSGLTLLVRVGRYGPMAQIGSQEETDKPKFAKLRGEQRLDQITFEEALELFKLPRNLGKFEDKDVHVSIGRFGPYVRLGDYFVSIKKDEDPYTITYERAVELIHEKRKAQAEKIIMTFDEDPTVQVVNGRWGPYIVFGDRNIRIPKDTDPKSFTLEAIRELAENTPVTVKTKGGWRRKPAASADTKPAAKKASKKAARKAAKKSPAKKATAKAAVIKKVPAKKKAAAKKAAPASAASKKPAAVKKAAKKSVSKKKKK